MAKASADRSLSTDNYVTFSSPAGFPIPAVTEEQMRDVDRIAIEETGPNLYQMMENAGRNLALTAMEMITPTASGPVVVLAGTGGNGGGGIAAARHLANRGLDVTIAITDEDHLGDVPATQLRVYGATAGWLVSPADLYDLAPALVVDALIGYSLRGAPQGVSARMISWVQRQQAPVLSLDMPSGIDATTGGAPGSHITANQTMTLALPKIGLANPAAGTLLLADIGIPIETYRRAGIDLREPPFQAGFRIELSRIPT